MDGDAYLQQALNNAPSAPKAASGDVGDQYLQNALKQAPESPQQNESHWYDTALNVAKGAVEPALHAASWVGSAIPAGVAGYARYGYGLATGEKDPLAASVNLIHKIQDPLVYQPQTQTGKGIENIVTSNYNPLTWIPSLAHLAGEKVASATGSPAAGFSTENTLGIFGLKAAPIAAAAAPQVLSDSLAAIKGASPFKPNVPAGKESQFASGGSAATTNATISSNASPEIQAAIKKAAQDNGINPDAAARVVQADSLPVPVRLTRGQATQDVNMISYEQNNKGALPELAEHFNNQNHSLVANLDALRDMAGPDVFSRDAVTHGDSLIQAYRDMDKVANDDISAKYQAMRDANGGTFPVDFQTLANNVNDKLKNSMLSTQDPGGQLSELVGLARRGGGNLENFESMRSNLATFMRTSTDGNAVAAAGLMRDAMESLPLQEGAAGVKGLADDARAAARARFKALEADPAYEAAVNGTVPPDRFVQKFITGPTATRDGVAAMRNSLAGNDTALQTMNTAVVDHLKNAAGIDPLGNGNFSQSNYNKQLFALQPRMDVLLPGELNEHLKVLGNVARDTQAQPRGSYVNNSNTLTGALAEGARSIAGPAAEVGANLATGGAYSAIAPIVRPFVNKFQKGRLQEKMTNEILNPENVVSAAPPNLKNIPK